MSATNIFGVGAVESATCPNRLEQRLIVAEGSVARFEDTDDGFHAANRVPGRFQVSKRFAKAQPDSPDQRFAYEVFDGNGEITFESDTGWVCTLRETDSRQQLKAVFFEDGRGISSLAFQRFLKDGRPMADAKTLLLEGDQIHRLRDFLAKIETVELDGEFGVRFSAEASEQLLEGRRLQPAFSRGESPKSSSFFSRT